MKHLISFLFLLAAITTFAQKQNIYFVKNDGSLVQTKDSADFVRVVAEPDSGTTLYNITEYYISGKRKLVGLSSSTYPVRFEGTVISFFENGKRRAINKYKYGELVGDQYDYFPNGKLYTVKKYTEELTATITGSLEHFPDLEKQYLFFTSLDSLGTAILTDGIGYYKGYDSNFKEIIEEGPVKDGKKDGEWKGREDTISFIETYKAGLFIQGIGTSTTGIKVAYKNGRVTPAEFLGGIEKFTKYLSEHINYPINDKDGNKQGKVIVSFDIDINGKVENIRVLRSPTPSMAEETVRVLRHSPNWSPAKKFGRNVPFKAFTIPINFGLQNADTNLGHSVIPVIN
ncbi:MAG: TonB family protein [Mucilaginibacter sp.]